MKQKHAARARFKTRIVIESLTNTPDGAGGFTSSWGTLMEVWAEMVPSSGGEALRAMQIEDSGICRITIRYVSGITTAMRVRFGIRLYNIRRIINNSEANNSLELIAEEGVAS